MLVRPSMSRRQIADSLLCHGSNATECLTVVLPRHPPAVAVSDVCSGTQLHVEKARRDLELLETKRHAAELRMRESQAKEAAEAARQAAAEQVERDRQQARPPVADPHTAARPHTNGAE